MGRDISLCESPRRRFRPYVSSQFWIPGTRFMKTQNRSTRSGLRLSMTACAMLALLMGCAQQRKYQAQMDERFTRLMQGDAGTAGQPTALVPSGGTGASPTGNRDEPPRRPPIIERGGLRIQVPQTTSRPTVSGENVELNFPETDIREFARAVLGD